MESKSLLEEKETSKYNKDVVAKCTGICSMFIMTLLVTVSATTVQLLRKSIPDFELNAIRVGFAFVCMSVYCIFWRLPPIIERNGITPTALYAVTQTINSIVFPISVEYIPIASSQCFSFTMGIIAGTIFFRIILKEEITVVRVVSNVLAILGIFLIIQPQHMFGLTESNVKGKGPFNVFYHTCF